MQNRLYCRINGYLVNLDEFSSEKCNISTSDYSTSIALRMDTKEPGWYESTVQYSDIQCIWKEHNNEVVKVLKGNLRVTEEDNIDCDISPFSHMYYAIYKGHKYINYQGCNNSFVYELGSYDIQSQDEGFIMYSPGLYRKTVKPHEIELEYKSIRWCIYKRYKFCTSEGNNSIFWIETYSRDDYRRTTIIT